MPTDLTDAERAMMEPLLPSPSHVGGKWKLRRIVEAVHLLRGGLPLAKR